MMQNNFKKYKWVKLQIIGSILLFRPLVNTAIYNNLFIKIKNTLQSESCYNKNKIGKIIASKTKKNAYLEEDITAMKMYPYSPIGLYFLNK